MERYGPAGRIAKHLLEKHLREVNLWLKKYFIPVTITEAENEYFKQAPPPKPVEPTFIDHPIDPARQSGASAALGGPLSLHAPWSMEPAIQLITEFEGFEAHAYPDPLSGGEPWTIGYGFTRLNGRRVRKWDAITKDEALAELKRQLTLLEGSLAKKIPFWSEMNAGQKGALLSFAWNLGENFYGSYGFYTITQTLRFKEWSRMPVVLEMYRNPGSAVEFGLLRRRKAEGRMWSAGKI